MVAALWLACLGAGCATADGDGDEAERTRPVPPEVADSSVETERTGGDEVAIPRVAVDVESEAEAGLSTEAARRVLQRDGQRCYRRALAGQRELEGRAVYELLISSQGRVVGTEKLSTSAPDRRLQRCLDEAFRELRFEIPPGNAALISRMYVRLKMWREVVDTDQEPSHTGERSAKPASTMVAAVAAQWL